jgi:hypothetical protein
VLFFSVFTFSFLPILKYHILLLPKQPGMAPIALVASENEWMKWWRYNNPQKKAFRDYPGHF